MALRFPYRRLRQLTPPPLSINTPDVAGKIRYGDQDRVAQMVVETVPRAL